ncbi:MAG: hypothetical protein KF712_19870 [Akkermansiaceae bacterium]|nr:hypothetical protein [Akkermansiaceae bacterium]
MNRRQGLRLLLGLLPLSAGMAGAQDDPGKEAIGKVNVKVYYGTKGDPSVAGPRFNAVEGEVEKQLRGAPNLDFKHFLLLGGDQQPLFRSYENWAQPLRPSDEILVRFEARSRPTTDSARLDLEIWISRKKILKTDALLGGSTPLFILGPEWRGGRLIIAVSLAS